MDEVILAGHNLAMLVAADKLARRGCKVALLTDGKPLGGFFGGIQFEGLDFDFGMVMLEGETVPSANAALSSYDPGARYDCARFTAKVQEFVSLHVDRRRVDTPQVLVEGRRFADYIMCNRIEAFGALVTDPPRAAAAQGRKHELHPTRKLQGQAYDGLTYARAAAFNHGPQAQQRMFDPFLEKIAPLQARQLLATYHRAAWMPLYYPETVCAASRGETSSLGEYPFWIPAAGSTGALVAALVRRAKESACVRIDDSRLRAVRPSGDRVRVDFSDGRWMASDRFALGSMPDRTAELLGMAAQDPAGHTSLQLDFFLVRQDGIGYPANVLFVVDPAYKVYRLTDLDACSGRDVEWHRVVLETGTGQGPTDAAYLGEELGRLLALADPACVRHLGQIHARNALFLPSAETLPAAAAHLQALQQAASPALLSGALSGVGAAALHDQVVQGLAIAEAFV